MHLELSQPLEAVPGSLIQISIQEPSDELQAWRELAKRNALNAYADQDMIYDSLEQTPARDHSAFLNGYSPEDEGLYDDYSTSGRDAPSA